MSYSTRTGLGESGSNCIKVYADYGGTQIPDSVCAVTTSKTGHHPPRPNICNSTRGLQTLLRALGLYSGPIDGEWTPALHKSISDHASVHGVPWNGDPFSVSPSLCAALINHASQVLPNCPGALTFGCVIPPPAPLPVATSSAPDPKLKLSTAAAAASSLRKQRLLPGVMSRYASIKSLQPSSDAQLAPDESTPTSEGSTKVPDESTPTSEGSTKVPAYAWIGLGLVALGGVLYFRGRSTR